MAHATAAQLERIAADRERAFHEALHSPPPPGARVWNGQGVAAEQYTPKQAGAMLRQYFEQRDAKPQQQQKIGADEGRAAGAWINPDRPNGVRYDPASGGIVPVDTTPPVHIEDFGALQARMSMQPAAYRTLVDPNQRGPLSELLGTLLEPLFGGITSALAPDIPDWMLPQRIPPTEFVKWLPLPHSFPVWVQWPLYRKPGDVVFGVGLATHYLNIQGPAGDFPLASLFRGRHVPFLAVRELTPFGRVAGVPFQAGVWSVPMALCTAMVIGLESAYPAENIAVVVDSLGRSWILSWLDFKASPKWQFVDARNAVSLQYAALTGTSLSTRFVKEIPLEHAPFANTRPPNLPTAPIVVYQRDAGSVPAVAAGGDEED